MAAPTLHEPEVHAQIRARVESLRPDSVRKWGKMTIGQMLWHVNCSLEQSLGRFQGEPLNVPIPKGVIKFFVLKFPWGEGAPTNPAFVAKASHDFAAERPRTLRLIDEVAARDMGGTWPV